MRYGILFLLVLFMVSCSVKETEQTTRKKIEEKRLEIARLTLEVAELEKSLDQVNSGNEGSEKIAVEALPLNLMAFSHFIEVSGTAEAVKEAYISPELSGQIREIYVKEGDYVKKGQSLIKLNSEITESNIADLQASLDLASVVYEKQARLWEKGIGSEIQYLNAKNTKESLEQKLKALHAQMDMALLKSPVNGYVDEIYRKMGELAVPGQPLMLIVNLDEILINADISETYLSQVNEGEIVKVGFPVYPDMDLEVPIFRKGNVINPGNRTFSIQLKLQNPDKLLKPNILSVVRIMDFKADSAIVVPSAIIKQDISGSYLYALQQSNNKLIAKKVYIKTGKSYLDNTMVLEGLQSGQSVIVRGYNQVSDGSEVYVITGNAS